MIPPVRVPRLRKPPKVNLPQAPRPRLDNGGEAELLSGVVQDMEASAIEERFAKALDKQQIPYYFRYTFGAPRGLPGFFELDFLPLKNGIFYPIEVDSQFTHRNKGRADVLHDARVLAELDKAGIPYFPKVTHLMGEDDLIDQRTADATARKLFG